MSCSNLSDRYKLELQTKQAQLAKALTAYNAALENIEIENYKFDSGEGSQSVKRRDPEQLEKLIERLYRRIDWLCRKLSLGGGIVDQNLRRRMGTFRANNN